MALRPDYKIVSDDVRNYCTTTGEKGQLVVFSTAGSGSMMDNSNATVVVHAIPSGKKVAGLLFNDVVNIDITRQHLNQYKNEVLINGKVHLITRGEVATNLIHGTPTLGADAYLSENGYFRTTSSGADATPRVGRWKTLKDEDGFAVVTIEVE